MDFGNSKIFHSSWWRVWNVLESCLGMGAKKSDSWLEKKLCVVHYTFGTCNVLKAFGTSLLYLKHLRLSHIVSIVYIVIAGTLEKVYNSFIEHRAWKDLFPSNNSSRYRWCQKLSTACLVVGSMYEDVFREIYLRVSFHELRKRRFWSSLAKLWWGSPVRL